MCDCENETYRYRGNPDVEWDWQVGCWVDVAPPPKPKIEADDAE